VERRALLDMRDEGEISGAALRAVEHELDLEEARLRPPRPRDASEPALRHVEGKT
jgi:hypothetical protein